jgi:hypothetical protein
MGKKGGLVVRNDILEAPPSFWERLVRLALKAGAKPEAAEDILKGVDWMRRYGKDKRRVWVTWRELWKLLGSVKDLEARARLERLLFGEREYRYSEKSLEILEWNYNRRAELEYLYPERKLIAASERAEKTRARLWSVWDETEKYFRLFPRPVSAARALRDFFKTAVYEGFDYREEDEEEEAEDRPALVVPSAFEVEAWSWNPRWVAKDLEPEDLEEKMERVEEMKRDWREGWPLDPDHPHFYCKASFLAVAWFLAEEQAAEE